MIFKHFRNPVDSEQPPLVEKLISSLVQENIITSSNDIMTEFLPGMYGYQVMFIKSSTKSIQMAK